jgi:hypothetical protein
MDIANGKKFSGWTNPLGWTDDGKDDESVLVAYPVSEGPTKADNGEADEIVVHRESDIANGKKKSGWTNPLGWTDNGDGDEKVLIQMNNRLNAYSRLADKLNIEYPESGYSTKPDYGENDEHVVYREADINMAGNKKSGWTNPLSWTDNGKGDEKVLAKMN